MDVLLRITIAVMLAGGLLAGIAWIVNSSRRWLSLAHFLWCLVLVLSMLPVFIAIPVLLADSKTSGAEKNFTRESAVLMRVDMAGERDVHVVDSLNSSQHDESRLTKRVIHEEVFDTSAVVEGPRVGNNATGAAAFLLFLCIWAIGSLGLTVVAITRYCRLTRSIRLQHEPLTSDLQCQIDRVAAQIGLHTSPAICLTASNVTPFVLSSLPNPTVVLPKSIVQKNRSELELMLAHELAHIKRGDCWVRILETVCTTLQWWNPLVWICRRQIRVIEETCCDAMVIELYPQQREVYASLILDLLAESLPSSVDQTAFVSSFGAAKDLSNRVSHVLDGPISNGRRVNLWLQFFASALAGLFLLSTLSAVLLSDRIQSQSHVSAFHDETGLNQQPRINKSIIIRKQID